MNTHLIARLIRYAPSPNSGPPHGGRLINRLMQRDMVHGGPNALRDTVTRYGLPVRCQIRLMDRKTGAFVREAWSDATTGAYAFEKINPNVDWLVYAIDPARLAKPDINDQLVTTP